MHDQMVRLHSHYIINSATVPTFDTSLNGEKSSEEAEKTDGRAELHDAVGGGG